MALHLLPAHACAATALRGSYAAPCNGPSKAAARLLPAHVCAATAVRGSYAAPSKATARLLLRLRHSHTFPSATLRRSIRHLSHPTLIATLRQLVHQHNWQLALSMYLSLTDTPWFNWNSELHAELVALLTLYKQMEKVQALLEGLEEKLDLKQHMGFKKSLIQQYARFGLKDEMLISFESLQVHPNRHAVGLSLSSLLQGYASMDLPNEALAVLCDMQQQGLKPSFKDHKAILFSFGKSGMFDDMEAFALDMENLKLLNNPVVFNMILTTYATAENHGMVKDWLNKMLAAGLKPSVRTLNAIAKACGVLTEFSSSNTFVKMGTLLERLKSQGAKVGELEVVNDLLELCLIKEVVTWESVWQLDLHSTTMGSAYVMLCCWLEEVVKRLKTNLSFPSEIAIVTGWGKHSEIRGKSLTKLIIRDVLESVESPFRVDSQNKGRLLARPHAVAAWFSHL